jgi:glycopeptide antibiotics resistance protein
MIQPVPFRVDATSFWLNVVMTVPLGVLLPLLLPRLGTLRRIAACGLGVSAGIEAAQLLLNLLLGSRRTIDVNDLIANTAGAVIGWWLLRRGRAVRRAGR